LSLGKALIAEQIYLARFALFISIVNVHYYCSDSDILATIVQFALIWIDIYLMVSSHVFSNSSNVSKYIVVVTEKAFRNMPFASIIFMV